MELGEEVLRVVFHAGNVSLDVRKVKGELLVGNNQVWLHQDQAQKVSGGISGYDLRELVRRRRTMNGNILDFILAHPEFSPEKWLGWKGAILFFGTIYADQEGNEYVRAITRNRSEESETQPWYESLFRLDSMLGSGVKLAMR